jgi:hypothetical protein
MRSSVIGSASKWLGIIVCGGLGAFLSGYAAPLGATITGLREGGWNWQFLPFIIGGWVGGSLLALITITASQLARRRSPFALAAPLILPPIVAFVCGAVSFPILVGHSAAKARKSQKKLQASQEKYAALYQQLQRDPEIALREQWYLLYDEHGRAFNDSIKDPNIPYTLDLLKRFYAEAPVTRDVIFSHPACDTAFLSEHFQEAYDRAHSISYGMLASLVSNPNTPRELVEKVAQSETLPLGAVGPARRALKQDEW